MKTYQLNRTIPVEEGYDLVVAGGGPAGAAAAICAGRMGAKVLLIEATGCLGGMGTSGLVTAFDPMADGEKSLVGGFMREVVETLYQRGFLQRGIDPDSWRKNYHCWTPFNVFTREIDADANASARTVNGIVLNNIEGYRFISAKAFVDCTGDAVLADLCGCDCREAGRDTPRIMPATLPSLFAGIDWSKWQDQHTCLRRALADGHFTQYDRQFPGMSKVGHSTGYLNGGHLFNLNALRCESLSQGVMLGRRLAQEYLAFFRKYVPGCEAIEHVTTASLIGVRESRRIVGEYELTEKDYYARRQFPDQIGVFNKAIDIHAYDTSDAEYERVTMEYEKTGRLNPGECFGIPYGVIVPKGWRNLWVAGRCVSSDVGVHGSIRVQPSCSMMGQAAGTAAVQSIRRDQAACELDTAELVAALREHGATLPQEHLSSEMTRSPGE